MTDAHSLSAPFPSPHHHSHLVLCPGLRLPQVLSVNAAVDATDLVAKLRAYHHRSQVDADRQYLSE